MTPGREEGALHLLVSMMSLKKGETPDGKSDRKSRCFLYPKLRRH